MDKVAGFLEVGTNDKGEVVINHPDLKPDADGVGHIVFSPQQARALADMLKRKAIEIDGGTAQERTLMHEEWLAAKAVRATLTMTVEALRNRKCPECRGYRYVDDNKCRGCGVEPGDHLYSHNKIKCPTCDGTGNHPAFDEGMRILAAKSSSENR